MTALLCFINAFAAYLKDIPMTVTQPDGTVLHCFASGDEFFNYLHDKNGYTIMRHPLTGYYVYAESRDGQLVATDVVAGRQDPASKGLQPYALITPEEWMARRRAWEVPDPRPKNRDYIPNHGTLNNIAVFLRFSDDPQLTNTFSSIDNMFNDVSENAISMRSYFRAASYGAIEIPTTFYPGHNGETIISYQDTYPRSYFEPYDANTNPNGYSEEQRAEREFALLERTLNYINTYYPVPSSLNIDYDNDGYVDNICFIVKGSVGEWNTLLWPHKWALYDRNVYINGKMVWTFNFQLADASGYFNTSTMCHEMNHSLSAPDLYHYSHTGPTPVGIWDLMQSNTTPPQHCGAYMKMKYGHWVDEIPEITQAGTYTLHPISSPTPNNIAYKIASDDPNQFYVLEYRDQTSLFEAGLPGSGLLIYRIDTRFDGNANYNPDNGIYDEVYIFRPGGSVSENGDLGSAYFSANVGRTEFSASTGAYPFYTNGTIDQNFLIYDITNAGNTISFNYGTSSSCAAPTNVVATLQNDQVSLSWNAATNAVSYNVYRNGSLVGNTTATTYNDSGLVYGRYSYYLKSVDANGLLSASSMTVTVDYLPEGSIILGEGTSTNQYLPSYSYYNYTLSQQIYTASEIGMNGLITSISFCNEGGTKTRNYDVYMAHTDKMSFGNSTDWVPVTAADRVFSGTVTLTQGNWTTLMLDTPFSYNGTQNLLLVVDDNSGNWTGQPHAECRVYHTQGNQAIRVYSDDTNYNSNSPSGYEGTLHSEKNQLILKVVGGSSTCTVTATASPSIGGTVSGGGAFEPGQSCTLTATPAEGYLFLNWTHNGSVVATTPSYTFTVSGNATYVAHFEEMGVVLGEGTATSQYLPSYSYYNYTLSQQIFTASEIGMGGDITRLSFYNDGSAKTRSYDVYMLHTDKSVFENTADWVPVTANDKVFSGTVTLSQGCWTTLTLDTPFAYNGMSNLLLVVDDNSGNWTASPHASCRVYDAEGNQTLRIYNDNTNYDPYNPSSYSGTLQTVKNQVVLKMENTFTMHPISVIADPAEGGMVSGGDWYQEGQTCTLMAAPFEGYLFLNWTLNGMVVATTPSYSFTVEGSGDYVAHFEEMGVVLGEGTVTNQYLPSYSYYNYSLSQQIYTASEIGMGGDITRLSFCNDGATKTRNYDVYLLHTEKTVFEGANDWVPVTASDKVFSGTVVLTQGCWTTLTLDTPFAYNGMSNLLLVVDDNSGNWTASPHASCWAYGTQGTQAIRIYNDNINYDPYNPSGYNGVLHSEKNQIILKVENGFVSQACMQHPENVQVQVDETMPTEATVSWSSENDLFELMYQKGFIEGFENGFPEGWTTIDADGDGFNWLLASETMGVGYGHNGSSNCVYSQSYDNNVGVLYPDNYLVLRQVPLGGVFSFYACAQDNNWAGEHFGVAVSTNSNTNPSDFTLVQEWTMTAKGAGASCPVTRSGNRTQGNWYHYTVDLSSYAGYTGYIAIRHFNCSDWFYFDVDDIEYLYSNDFTIITGITDNYYTLTGLEAATDYVAFVRSSCGDGMSYSNWVPCAFTTGSPSTVDQTVNLENGWKWVSGYVEFDENTLSELENAINASSVSVATLKSQNGVRFYEDGNWYGNSLTALENEKMYMIQLDQNLAVTLTGPVVNPEEHPVTLSKGWNWIGFMSPTPMSLENALSNLTPNEGDVIKGQNGFATYSGTSWTGSLKILEPGRGYMYQNNGDEALTLIYPTAENVVQPTVRLLTTTKILETGTNQLISDITSIDDILDRKVPGVDEWYDTVSYTMSEDVTKTISPTQYYGVDGSNPRTIVAIVPAGWDIKNIELQYPAGLSSHFFDNGGSDPVFDNLTSTSNNELTYSGDGLRYKVYAKKNPGTVHWSVSQIVFKKQ